MAGFAVRAGLILICAAPLSWTPAQDTPPPAGSAPGPIEEIIVTGTRIPRRDFFSTSPIVTLARADLDLTGTTEIKNLLNDLPQVDPTADAGTGNVFGGESFVNLRALGANRTLVLLNGRRYPSQGINGSVDLNALPPVLIDRVELITGGASAVYGSDAMAGAINFILRDDFAGLQSNLQYALTDRGDGDRYAVDLAFGTPIGDGRGSLTLFGDYFRRDEVLQDARAYSSSRIVSDDQTGQLNVFDSFASPASSIAGVGPFYTFEPDGTPRLFVEPDDRFALSGFRPLLASMERYSVNLFGKYELGRDLDARFEFTHAHSHPLQKQADEFFQFVDVNVDRPDIAEGFRRILANDADPDGDGIGRVFLARTFSPERGPSTVDYPSDFDRGLVAIEGSWGAGWRWRGDASYATNERQAKARNDIAVSRIQQGLLVDPVSGQCTDTSGGCTPVNPFGAGNLTPAAAQFMTLQDSGFTERSRETYLTLTASGSPLSLSAGDLDVALGIEYRRFRLTTSFPNDNLMSGDSLLFGDNIRATAGSIAVKEAYTEARLPLLQDAAWAKYLGLDLGVRLSDYDILDSTQTTWKLGAEWQLRDGLRLRAMRQRAIRAPTMSDLFQGTRFAFTDLELGPTYDQCSASRDPAGNGLTDLCIAQGIAPDRIGVFEANVFPVAVSVASNPDARPESARTWSGGVVWQSRDADLSVSLDYFDIEIDDALANAGHVDLVRLCFLSRNPDDPTCRAFTRAASGDIDTALITTINTAVATSEGVDFALRGNWDLDGWALFGSEASLALSFSVTHVLAAGSQGSTLLPFFNCAGKFAGFCGLFNYQGAVPDWRATARMTYASGPLSTSLRWRYVGELANAEAEQRRVNGQSPPVLAVPTVPDVSYVDLTFTWVANESVSLNLGIDNLLDKDPPILGSDGRDANTDPTTYDLLGRRLFLRATLNLD